MLALNVENNEIIFYLKCIFYTSVLGICATKIFHSIPQSLVIFVPPKVEVCVNMQYLLNWYYLIPTSKKSYRHDEWLSMSKCEKETLILFPRVVSIIQVQFRLCGYGSGKLGLSITPLYDASRLLQSVMIVDIKNSNRFLFFKVLVRFRFCAIQMF